MRDLTTHSLPNREIAANLPILPEPEIRESKSGYQGRNSAEQRTLKCGGHTPINGDLAGSTRQGQHPLQNLIANDEIMIEGRSDVQGDQSQHGVHGDDVDIAHFITDL